MSSDITPSALGRRNFLGLMGLSALAVSGCSFGPSGGSADSSGALEVNAATYMPPSYTDVYPAFQIFMDGATQASDGAVTFDFQGSGTLLAADELMTGLTQSVTDLAFQVSSYNASTYPILGSYALPFVLDENEQLERALASDSELYSILNDQLAGSNLRMLGSIATVPQWLWTTKRPVREPDDLKGLRIRTAGDVEGRTISALGGAPVSISSEELFEALERGTVDGVVSYPGTIPSRDLQEILAYGTVAPFSAYSMDAYVRDDWFGALSTDSQEALEAGGRDFHTEGGELGYRIHEEEFMPVIERDIDLIELDSAQIDRFRAGSASVVDWWAGEVGDRAVADAAVRAVRGA